MKKVEIHAEDFPGNSSTRADTLVLRALQAESLAPSRGALKDQFDQGKILLHGRPLRAAVLIKPGDYLLEIADWEEIAPGTASLADPEFSGSFLKVIYENASLLAIDKPSGVPSVPHSPRDQRSAVNLALAHAPEISIAGPNPLEGGLLHRLDTETSGVLLFAKNPKTFAELKAAWKSGSQVKKIYRAIVTRKDSAPELPPLMDFPLGHDLKSSRRMRPVRDSRDEKRIRGNPLPARTRILNRQELSAGRLDLRVQIETGVLHQIRCHLASLGWPIDGDPIYLGQPAPRLLLHAWRLILAREGMMPLEIQANLPEGWPEKSF